MEPTMAAPILSMKKRTVNIREVDNGFVLRCTVESPAGNITTDRYMEKELVVTTLPQLLKTVKVFFEPILVEEAGS